MLLDDVEQTIGVARKSLDAARRPRQPDSVGARFYLDSVGVSEAEQNGILELIRKGECKVDPVVSYLISATNGIAYKHLIGTLETYPIPNLRLPDGNGKRFLDVGCNWGRWSIAAARKGYSVVGVDPSLGALHAARRVSRALGLSIEYVVADARYLPFREASFDTVFSYSVLQHLSKSDVGSALSQIDRVLVSGGVSFIQMPTLLGVRCLYHQARRRFQEPQGFDVRYWSVPELKRTFSGAIGATDISVDCYFGIGLQPSDRELMSTKLRTVLSASESLRALSRWLPPLKYVADSVYVRSTKS